jgi:hypothetical protein
MDSEKGGYAIFFLNENKNFFGFVFFIKMLIKKEAIDGKRQSELGIH